MIPTTLSTEEKIKKILVLNGIQDEVSEVLVKDLQLKQGMLTDNRYVTVYFKDSEKKPLHLFVKIRTANESHNEMLTELRAFEKEAQFFSDYVPAADKFCASKGLPNFMDFYAKFYYGDGYITVFENIVVEKGYVLASAEDLQDMEEAKASLTTLAKHHGVSYAMIQEEGGPEKFFQRFEGLDYESHSSPHAKKMLDEMCENGLKMSIMLLKKTGMEESQRKISTLETLQGKMYSLYMEGLENEEGDLAVLNHGDYWLNNMMMLKDPITNRVIGHKAVDLQLPRYASPAVDLSVFIFSSIKGDLRREKLTEFLKHYLDVFKTTTAALGHPVQMSLEDLFSLFRRKFRSGFWLGLIVAGPAYAVLKDFDRSEMGDVSNMAVYFDGLMQKWLDNNPEKGKVMAKSVLELVGEYEKLME